MGNSMGGLGRIGLQKRIFLYVAIGLALMLGVFAFLGLRAIRHSVDLVFQERYALARELAAGLSRGFEHVAEDVKEDMSGLSDRDSMPVLEKAVQRAFYHLSVIDKFPLFKVSGVWLITRDNKVIARPSNPFPFDEAWISSHFKKDPSLTVISQSGPGSRSFVQILVPLIDGANEVWSILLLKTVASSSPEPFTPLRFLELGGDGVESTKQSQYILEIVNSEGIVLLNIGSREPAGKTSSHFLQIKTLRENNKSDVIVQRIPEIHNEQDHIVVMTPVPGSDLYLAMEQEEDVALALPNELLRQLLLIGGIGFLITLFIAWLTTRSVVKPVEALIQASERLANGHLSSPVKVHAQDEIGRLAENMETMRRQLNSALQGLEQANRELEVRVRERTQRLSQALGKIISAQEEERRRLARELHDETAQALVTLNLILDGIRDNSLIDPQSTRRKALEAKELSTNLLEETRRLIFDLRPTVLDDFGLPSALHWYAERHLENRGIKVTFKADNTLISPQVQVAMFRIAQEAINNVARHSNAKNAGILVSNHNQSVTIIVEDDGKGFDLERNCDHNSQVGLVGMRERANLLGAKLEINSFPGKGTRICLEVPLEP